VFFEVEAFLLTCDSLIVCVVLMSFSQNDLSKMYGNKDTISFFFEIFETGPAQICADLLEIRIEKKI
jgi:hypothetical protein